MHAFHNDPFLAVQLTLFPRRRKRRQRFADLSLFRVVVHRRKQDRGVVHRHHHDFVAANGLDKAVLTCSPRLVKAVALFRLRVHVRPVVMVLARLIPAPDIRRFLFPPSFDHLLSFLCPVVCVDVRQVASLFVRAPSLRPANVQPRANRGLLCKAAAGCPGRLRPRGFAVPHPPLQAARSRSAAFRCAKPTLGNAFSTAASPFRRGSRRRASPFRRAKPRRPGQPGR